MHCYVFIYKIKCFFLFINIIFRNKLEKVTKSFILIVNKVSRIYIAHEHCQQVAIHKTFIAQLYCILTIHLNYQSDVSSKIHYCCCTKPHRDHFFLDKKITFHITTSDLICDLKSQNFKSISHN